MFTIGTIGDVPSNFHLLETEGITHINYTERNIHEDEALELIRTHQINLLINFTRGTYYINNENPSSELIRIMILGNDPQNNLGTNHKDYFGLREEKISGKAIRYADWIVPGIIGMNMMFNCLFGVGYVLVRYRKNGVLKRIKATPVSSATFLIAQTISRYLIVIVSATVVFFGTSIFFSL